MFTAYEKKACDRISVCLLFVSVLFFDHFFSSFFFLWFLPLDSCFTLRNASFSGAFLRDQTGLIERIMTRQFDLLNIVAI